MGKVVARGCGMVEPLEEGAEREETLVKGAHDIRVGEGRTGINLAV